MHRLKYLLIALLFSISALAQTTPWVTVTQPTVNFGFIPQTGEFGRKVTIVSNIDDTLRIGKISTYCDCITASLNSEIIYPGDSVMLELKLDPKNLIGKQYKVTHIYDENKVRLGKITVKASVYKEVSNFKTVYVDPVIVNFSQFGDKGVDEAEFFIKNISDETVPLELMFTNSEYFELDFPGYVEANKMAKGNVVLTEKGKSCQFAEAFTFKYVDGKSQELLFSVPVKRKVFSGKADNN